MFEYDTTDINERGAFVPIPTGDYVLRITKTEEKQTKNKDPLVVVEFTVDEGDYAGHKIWHNVPFLPKQSAGAGISKHFLHMIGEEYEGKIMVNPDHWIDKIVHANVGIDNYTALNGQEKQKNTVNALLETTDIEAVPF